MSKPTNKPGWNPTSNSTEPSSTKKAAGWSSGEKPSSAHFNWLFKTVSEWIDHIDAEGVQGPKGDTGPQGSQGLKGDTGATGPQGLQGDKGDTGATGAQGLQGDKGDTGAQGIQGLKGDTGATGPQGLKGDTGPQGATGASGSISSADLARIAALEAVSGVVAASPVTVTFPYNGGAAPSEYSIGNSGSSVAVNWANGASQFVTLTADATISFTGATAGNTYYLRIQQGGYGLKRVVGWPTNIVWNGGSVPTISTAAWTVDVIGCYYDGTNYYGYVSQGYFTAPSAIDTKNGYIAGGVSLSGSTFPYASQLEKINFNSDGTLSVVQAQFGYIQNSSGTYIYPTAPQTYGYNGQGTQSSTHGYRLTDVYSGLTTVNNQTNYAAFKVPFSNDTTSTVIRLPAAGNNKGFDSRGGIIQNSSYAWRVGIDVSNGKNMNKLAFSTDTVTRYAFTSSFSAGTTGSGPNIGFGLSSENSGVLWIENNSTSGIKLQYATDTSLTLATFNVIGNSYAGSHFGEAVDSLYSGYYIRNTNALAAIASPVATLYKGDKSVDTWTTSGSTVSSAASGAAAVQGLTAGYFCGAVTNYDTASWQLNSTTYAPVNSIKKILYSPETLSIHSATLSAAKTLASGFEG